jgi:hypothetical protein
MNVVYRNIREGKKMVGLGEVKSTIATAIAAAFGFIIALIWRDIIVGLFNLAGLKIDTITTTSGAITATISGVVITVVCIFGILYISKWGRVKK